MLWRTWRTLANSLTWLTIMMWGPKSGCLVGAEFTTRPQPKRHRWMTGRSFVSAYYIACPDQGPDTWTLRYAFVSNRRTAWSPPWIREAILVYRKAFWDEEGEGGRREVLYHAHGIATHKSAQGCITRLTMLVTTGLLILTQIRNRVTSTYLSPLTKKGMAAAR